MPYQGLWQQAQLANQLQGTRFVKGFQGALSCPCLPGRTLLMDEDEAIFYIKEVSGYGNASIKRYRFEEIEEPKQPEYVTKEDFDKLKEQYESVVSKLESFSGDRSEAGATSSANDNAPTS